MRCQPRFWPNLWRGTVPSALRTGVGSALYFTSLNLIRERMRHSTIRKSHDASVAGSSVLPTLSHSENLASGALARTCAGFVLMPLTVLKVRFESNLYRYPSLRAAGWNIYQSDGLRGFFAGFGATAMRDAPYAGMYVLFYEVLKTRLASMASNLTAHPNQGQMQSTLAGSVNFASATLAAAICSVISNPFDAIKTRIQLQPHSYRNVGHAAARMMKEEGLGSFWHGLTLRLARKALSSALAWTMYEELIRRSHPR